MKRNVLATLALCVLVAFASPAWSFTIDSGVTDVGLQDLLLYSELLADSADQTEIDWVNLKLGTNFTVQDKYTVVGADWTAVDSSPGIWALELNDDPMYILVKIGTGSLPAGTPDHYLFQNLNELAWAVIAFSDLNISITDVSRISHVGEFGTQVPEPATMLLLGSGLVGLWGLRRKFKK